ncbi:unnamed protein product [Ilex paraguariensis]|uniref:ABC transmembrane type-1 domain-containing protein n=2 Tax=Ilex paraguariensis TaxID=185542 RepID=A0ABC8RCE1_9AQUA
MYFNNEAFEVVKYDEFLKRYEDAALKTQQSLAFLNFGQNVIFSMALSVAMVLCSHGIMDDKMTVGDGKWAPIPAVSSSQLPWQCISGDCTKSYWHEIHVLVLEESAEIRDDDDAKPLKLDGGSIQFDNVHFSYIRERKILDGMSLLIPAGKSVAIVGTGGSGKSTILRLLFRFFDTDSGHVRRDASLIHLCLLAIIMAISNWPSPVIRIDGQDIRKVTLESLRKPIGVVPQDTVLFNDTIFHYIHYGRLSAMEEEVYDAARRAAIHNTVMNFPDKYSTAVGERGLKLSGGEKQQVALARAFLKALSIFVSAIFFTPD